ncbi:MAG: tyrosine-type recombinase/integrase [Methanoregulaceae archaeon]|nr:tyrosine-type recombinase/integrase [Methanoregulaceae archaeon]
MSFIRPKHTGTKLADGRLRTQVTVGGMKHILVQRKGESAPDFWSRVAAFKEGEVRKMPAPGMKVAQAFDIWYESKQSKLRESTLRSYKWVGESYIKKLFGMQRIDKLEPIIVDRQLAKIEHARTAKLTRDVGRAFYRYALKCGWATRNPFELADPIPYTPEARQIITSAEAEKVIAQADPRFVPILRFMRHMGLRKGEALNLMWSEIEDGWITLSASKTAMGRQPIPMPEICEDILAQLPRTSVYVFPNIDGMPWNPRTLTSAWHEACDAAGVPRCPVYDLRGLFASELAQRIDKDTLRRLMRHTDTRTTEMHYIHVERERLQRSINAKYKLRPKGVENA